MSSTSKVNVLDVLVNQKSWEVRVVR